MPRKNKNFSSKNFNCLVFPNVKEIRYDENIYGLKS